MADGSIDRYFLCRPVISTVLRSFFQRISSLAATISLTGPANRPACTLSNIFPLCHMTGVAVSPPNQQLRGYTFSLLAKCPAKHYNKTNQTDCDRGKRRWHGASREPVAGVNRRRGPSLPLSEHPATNRRGAPPTAHVKSACIHLQASRVAPRRLSVPGNAGREGFSFFAVISRRKKQPCWTSI